MKTTLITGASGGIGEALATRFAQRKHNLLLVARNAAKLAAQCRQLAETYGISAQYLAADLALPTAPTQIFAETQPQRPGFHAAPTAGTPAGYVLFAAIFRFAGFPNSFSSPPFSWPHV